jgi:hypothetical protein
MCGSWDESGQYEVCARSFSAGGGERQVSTGGGDHPRWRRDGRELFYYAEDGKLMAAALRIGSDSATQFVPGQSLQALRSRTCKNRPDALLT